MSIRDQKRASSALLENCHAIYGKLHVAIDKQNKTKDKYFLFFLVSIK